MMAGPREAGNALRRMLQQVAPHDGTAAAASLAMPMGSAAGSLYEAVGLWDFGTWDTSTWGDDGTTPATPPSATGYWGTGFWDKHYFSA
jgi:hypothetical protein